MVDAFLSQKGDSLCLYNDIIKIVLITWQTRSHGISWKDFDLIHLLCPMLSNNGFSPLSTGNTWRHHQVLVSIVAADALVLEHQAISSHNTDSMPAVLC